MSDLFTYLYLFTYLLILSTLFIMFVMMNYEFSVRRLKELIFLITETRWKFLMYDTFQAIYLLNFLFQLGLIGTKLRSGKYRSEKYHSSVTTGALSGGVAGSLSDLTNKLPRPEFQSCSSGGIPVIWNGSGGRGGGREVTMREYEIRRAVWRLGSGRYCPANPSRVISISFQIKTLSKSF